ncbi:TetR/AcrR family transcriptional regulator [Arthrobacter pascens]|uniref:TetR/AcrR family transcriptional regulator n=1 Tax=Arthrobacter pascens TaxID=1677 RepID=UPI00196A720A|nr:TetR/AcrR family transcriptional regulator [Arthrobacter pascens]MBN3497736.1 TetR/AcrR family transcriptional regulator [Arthrobacter pascens]
MTVLAAEQLSSPPSVRSRRDTVRNKRRLLNAAGELLREDPQNASMPAIAQKAELSVATAYRYFPTLEELHKEYLHGVLVNLRDYSLGSPLHGKALFEDVVARHVKLLETYGPAMIQLRSREGFLTRLHRGDEVIGTLHEAWERPVREVIRELGLSEGLFDFALMFCNSHFDPREVDDLLKNRGSLSEAAAIRMFINAFYGALKGMAES